MTLLSPVSILFPFSLTFPLTRHSDDVAFAIAYDGSQWISDAPADGSATDDEPPTTNVHRIPGWTPTEHEHGGYVATIPRRRRIDG